MDRVEINIITCAKRDGTEFLSGTLASLFASDWAGAGIPVNIFLGSDNDTHVEPFLNDPRVTIVPWPFGNSLSGIRALLNNNYMRALAHAPRDCDCFVFEDDIEFNKRWLARTQAAIDYLEKERQEYVLSLYMPSGVTKGVPNPPGLPCKFWSWGFFGSQGLYFPARVRDAVLQHCKATCDIAFTDILISKWTREHKCMFATAPSLIQHRGNVSTGGMRFHQASDWEAD